MQNPYKFFIFCTKC